MLKSKPLLLALPLLCTAILADGQPNKRNFALRKMSSLIDTTQSAQPVDYALLRAHLPEMVLINGGSFTMGCTAEQGADCKDDLPPQQASVGSFKLSKTEITNAQYCHFLNACHVDGYGWYGGRRMMDVFDVGIQIHYVNKQWQPKKNYANHPMVCVTWFGADAYCRTAGGRLPSQAEWEFAARGGGKNKYSGSNNLRKVGWYAGNSGNRSHPIATLHPNEFGLYDMSGNVWEWCSDVYVPDGDKDDDDKDDDPADPSDDEVVHILRGGGWYDDEQYCRVSFRDGSTANTSDNSNGFRMAMDAR